MNILITGAAGFIGSNLANRFYEKGNKLTLIDNLEFGYLDNLKYKELQDNLVVHDIRNALDDRLLEGVDIVFHFAGISSLPECQSDPKKTFDVNVIGTINLLEKVVRKDIRRFIFASTSAVYENSNRIPFDESELVAPDLFYSQSKKVCEDIIKSYVKNYKLDAIICRFFNVYGPNQDFKRKNPPFTSYLVKEGIEKCQVKVFNTQDIKRDYIYVNDLLEILEFLMTNEMDKNEIVLNLCSGHTYSPTEIVKILEEIIEKKIEIISGKSEDYWNKYPILSSKGSYLITRIEKEILKTSIGDNKRLKQIVNKTKFKTMEEGLREVVNYQKNSGL
jgi:nucleoside-diphosphate-sugar epimerase